MAERTVGVVVAMLPETRQLIVVVSAVVVVAMAVLVSVDARRSVARRHGLGAVGWLVVCLATGPLGVIGYLVSQRRREEDRHRREGELDRQANAADWEGLVQRERGIWPEPPEDEPPPPGSGSGLIL